MQHSIQNEGYNACNLDNFKKSLREKGIENPWQHVADLAKKSGHYYDPDQKYATKDDLPILEKYNEKAKQEHKFVLDVLPCPFDGDIFNAKIIILTLNPGFIEMLQHTLYDALNPEAQERITKHHIEALELATKKIHSHDEIVNILAENYWRSKTRELREEYGFDYSDFAIVQYVGYQSEKYNQSKKFEELIKQFESIKFTELLIKFIIKYRTDDYCFIIARKQDFWKPLLEKFYNEDEYEKHVINRLRNYRGSFITKGNMEEEDFKIIKRLSPSKIKG
jgi:hypothetical protein